MHRWGHSNRDDERKLIYVEPNGSLKRKMAVFFGRWRGVGEIASMASATAMVATRGFMDMTDMADLAKNVLRRTGRLLRVGALTVEMG